MFFFNWLKWLNQTFRTGRRRRHPIRRIGSRLQLLQLEDRIAPAGVTATLGVVVSPPNAFVPAAAHAGDTLNYTAIITNNTGGTVSAVNYNGTPLDGNTTLVPGSLHASPIAN